MRFAPDWLDWLPLMWADYWVIDLDPGYQWAVVGEPGREHLWICHARRRWRVRCSNRSRHAVPKGYDVSALVLAAPLHD